MRRVLIFFALIVLCSFPILAYTAVPGDYVASTASLSSDAFFAHNLSYSLCAGDYRIIPLLFTNTGNTEERIILAPDDAVPWASLSARQLILSAHRKGAVFVELAPPSEKAGQTTLTLLTQSASSRARIPLSLTVGRCYAASLFFEHSKETLCQGDTHSTTLTVTNDGTLPERLDVMFSGVPTLANMSIPVLIQPGAHTAVPVSLASADPGTYHLVASADVQGTLSQAATDVTIVGTQACSALSFSGPSRASLDFHGTSISLTISQVGIVENDYSLSLDGPVWITSSITELHLVPGQRVPLTIRAFPPADLPYGEYGAELIISTGDAAYHHPISFRYRAKPAFVQPLVSFFTFYRYYLYSLVLLVVLFFSFRPWFMRRRVKGASAAKVQEKALKGRSSLAHAQSPARRPLFIAAGILLLAGLAALLYFFRAPAFAWALYFRYYLAAGAGFAIIAALVWFLKQRSSRKKKHKRHRSHRVFFAILYLLLAAVLAALIFFIPILQQFIVLYWPYLAIGLVLLGIIVTSAHWLPFFTKNKK